MPARKLSARGSPDTKIAGISSSAVKRATGKEWKDWLAILDRAGAGRLGHAAIAAWLAQKHPELGGWWSQMVTVGYEQARGLRVRHQTAQGFKVSASKTVAAPVAKLYEAFFAPKLRKKWLEDPDFEIRTTTVNKSMRIVWPDGTAVSANFYPKGAKSQVALEHSKLPDAKAAQRRKAWWAENLARLPKVVGGAALPATRPRARP
jgi:hypothetical protein